jgi:hypothetical protein
VTAPPLQGRSGFARRTWSWPGSRLALGLSPTPLSGLFLPIGIALGPEGLRLLSPQAIALADPVVSVALAALGVLIGLGLDMRRPQEGRLLAAASLEAGLTIAVVSSALLTLTAPPVLGVTGPGATGWLFAFLLGICAAASSTESTAPATLARRSLVERVGDLDDVLPILLGGVALALMRTPEPMTAAWLTAQGIGIGLAVGCAGWLLVTRAASESEQRVFTLGTILLLGGTAEFLSLSPLLAGLVAGALWSAIGGEARDRVSRDVRHMQHPLVVLLLLIAGARVLFSAPVWLVCAVYVSARLAAKLAGGRLLRSIAARAGREVPGALGLHLLSPGVVAVAFALSVNRTADPTGVVLAVAVAGSIASEILSLLMRPGERAA